MPEIEYVYLGFFLRCFERRRSCLVWCRMREVGSGVTPAVRGSLGSLPGCLEVATQTQMVSACVIQW